MEDKSIALELIEKLIKLLKFALVVICLMFVSACVAFVSVNWKIVNFIDQYEFSTDVEMKADDGSSAIYQNGKGNTINGSEHKSDEKNDKKIN